MYITVFNKFFFFIKNYLLPLSGEASLASAYRVGHFFLNSIKLYSTQPSSISTARFYRRRRDRVRFRLFRSRWLQDRSCCLLGQLLAVLPLLQSHPIAFPVRASLHLEACSWVEMFILETGVRVTWESRRAGSRLDVTRTRTCSVGFQSTQPTDAKQGWDIGGDSLYFATGDLNVPMACDCRSKRIITVKWSQWIYRNFILLIMLSLTTLNSTWQS